MTPARGAARQPTPLRRLLVLVTVGAIALASAVLGAVYVTSTRAILVDRLDERLSDAIDRAEGPKYGGEKTVPKPAEQGASEPGSAEPPASEPPPAPEKNARASNATEAPSSVVERLLTRPGRGNPDFALVVGPDGAWAAGAVRDGAVGEVVSPELASLADLLVAEQIETRTLPAGLGSYRLAGTVDQQGNTVVLGVPLAETDAVVGAAVAVAVWTSLGVAAVAGVIVLLWVRRALQPLEKIVHTASTVSRADLLAEPEVLHERVGAQASDERSEAGRVGAALNRLLDHITRAFEQREATEQKLRVFVADASHELRTPLASIRGYAELTRLSREDLPPDSAHALRRIEEESTRMSTIVEDLLLLARLDQGVPLRRDPLDLEPLVRELVGDARVAAPGHSIEFEVSAAPADAGAPLLPVIGDADKLRQALGNLVSNAWRHTPEGTRVRVLAKSEGSRIAVTVSDSGPGVPDEALGSLFERFVRVDSARSREQGGTGLGLAIARSVIEAHGGTIVARREAGEMVFAVSLPRGGAEAE